MDRKNLEAVIRSMLGNPGDASKQRMKIKNVARPEDPEPTSDKSILTRTAEIKHKIIDEQETTMDKEKRLAGLLGFSDSLIEAAKNISKNDKEEKNEKGEKEEKNEKIELSGKTKVDTDPKLNRIKNEEAESLDEKLKGKQHKLDKNKNGKLDSQDFEMLRKEEKDDDGWYAHREIHGSKGVSKEDWKKGIRMNSKGEKVQMRKEDVELDETGMPTSVIKHKQKLAQMSDEELAKTLGSKSDKDLRGMAWRHGYGKPGTPGHEHYVKRVSAGKKTNEEIEQVDELDQGVNSLMGRYSKKAADKVNSGEESPEKRAAGRLLSGMKRRGGTGGIPAAKVPAVQREEVEELDELKKSTLANYIGGASQDKSHAAHDIGKINQKAATTGTSASDRAERDDLNKRHGNRSLGISRAAAKLAGQAKVNATEEYELDETSALRASKYKNSAEKDILARVVHDEPSETRNRKIVNRAAGMERANKIIQKNRIDRKLKVNATEETEIGEAKHTTDGEISHPIMSARKAISLGSYEHTHADGSKSTISRETGHKILSVHDNLKPSGKEAFTKELHSSPEGMKAAIKRGAPEAEKKTSKVSLAGSAMKKEETDTSGNPLVEAVKRFILNRGN